MRYLLDTDMVVYIRQARPPGVLRRFAQLPPGDAAISVISYGELRFGTEKSQDPASAGRKLDALISLLPVLSLPISAGEFYGRIRNSLRKGQIIGSNDLWIAAHAVAAGLILVTNNEREFRRVPGLQVENWAAPS